MTKVLTSRRDVLLGALLLGIPALPVGAQEAPIADADLVIRNGRITTLDARNPQASAVVIDNGQILFVGTNERAAQFIGPTTVQIDAGDRRMIPGLVDSHSHYLRSGLSYTRELRWDGVPTLRQALEMVGKAAEAAPGGEWIRVIGGWTPWQFEERRFPTAAELDQASPNNPVYIQYFYSAAIANTRGQALLGMGSDTPDPEGGRFERDAAGNPTGMLVADPHPRIFYDKIAALPPSTAEEEANSTLHLFHDLARWGLTSVIDAGGGGFRYPEDYSTSEQLAADGALPLRTSFFLFASRPKRELEDFLEATAANEAGTNLDLLKKHGFEIEGAGEYLLWEAGDFENFRSARPELSPTMEENLSPIITLLVRQRWPFKIHGTYEESIARILSVIERVNNSTPLNGLRWSVEHAETIKPETVDRIIALGGGVAIQNRMVFLGDDFVQRYGADAAKYAPPLRYLFDSGVPFGMGTDATRGSTFNPWISLHFLVTGETASGRKLYDADNLLTREEALLVHTVGSAWFSGEESVKGRIVAGQFADLALLSNDYFAVSEDEIKDIESVLTVVGGKVVHASGDFREYSVELPKILPAWSPLNLHGPFWVSSEGK